MADDVLSVPIEDVTGKIYMTQQVGSGELPDGRKFDVVTGLGGMPSMMIWIGDRRYRAAFTMDHVREVIEAHDRDHGGEG